MTDIETLLAKEAIRELVLLYCRGVDRKDIALLRDLYTADATDTHGDTFDGTKDEYLTFLEASFPYMRYGGHHVCNHLISVDGDRGEGEVCGIAYHLIPDRQGGWIEDMMALRYIDHYAREADGKWRFAKRLVTYDLRIQRPFIGTPPEMIGPGEDVTYSVLASRLFANGPRA
jgi:ketosteroid isomerase-like protein